MKKYLFFGLLVISAATLSFTLTSDENFTSLPQSSGEGTHVGQFLPDVTLKDVNGKTSRVSDLKGKVVLVDLWASWCPPCRRENPNIVMAHKKYSKAKFKDAKGFEIYSISLDRDKAAWLAAIKMDKLNWKYHVSDLAAWDSKAASKYKVGGIPANFLLDKNGKILAKNLKGAALHRKLDELVKEL